MGGIGSIAAKIGCTGESLRGWVRQAERDQGHRPGPTSDDRARRDTALQADIKRAREANFQVYGVRKVWRVLCGAARSKPRSAIRRRLVRGIG